MEPVNNSQQVAPPPVAPVINPTPPSPSPQRKKGKLGMLISLLIILLLLSTSGVAGFVIYKNLNKQPEQIACTLEAMICPDGSSVGRTGPNCEFSPCPTQAPDPTADWKTYKGEGFSFKYPNGLFEDPSESNSTYIDGDVNNSIGFSNNIRIKELFSNEVGSLEEYLQLYSYHLNYHRSELDVNNIKFYRFTSNPSIESKSIRFLTSRGDYVYEFYLNYNNPKYVTLLEQIVSTFKFTE